ncbi:MAG: exopolysaccharide biosynthesis polyprenyl glycosylphosphotransferase [Solirubrobacterales bacterium]|jgi:exopolysaccharide biosynthesis polyprenyl glycosylphosphotransferase
MIPTTALAASLPWTPPAQALAAVAAVSLALVLLRHAAARLGVTRLGGERVLVLGSGRLAHTLIAGLEACGPSRFKVVGVLADEGEMPPDSCRLLGRLEELEEVVESVRPERIVVALTARRGRMPVRSLLEVRVQGIAVEDGHALYERLTGKLAIEELVPSGLIFSPDCRANRRSRALGRALSLIAAMLALALLAPLLGLIALLVILDSGRPAFFLHERLGLGGRRFNLVKFRTMRRASRARSEWERDNLERITRVGRWLRRFRLDELPQFWNVLKGDMNLIGPRPHPVTNLRLFDERVPYYRLRLAVRPGITGWAQVRYGYANNLEQEIEKMRYDLYYIKHQSARLDLAILFETAQFMLSARESASPRRFAPEPTFGVR